MREKERFMFATILILFMTLSLHASSLTIQFENLRSEKGDVLYLLFNSPEGYPDQARKSVREGSLKASAAKVPLVLNDLPDGEYAFTVIHDENQNKKLDTNLVGMPTEGFGFSNNPKIFFGAPSFDRVKFKVSGDTQITVRMKHF